MRQAEKDFQSWFGKWLKSRWQHTGAFELKSVDTSLPFSALPDHQIEGLLHAKHEKIYMKLPDVGFQMPFDCFILASVPAWVVVRYSSGNWYTIDIDAFVKERDTSTRKSLTEERAAAISTTYPQK